MFRKIAISAVSALTLMSGSAWAAEGTAQITNVDFSFQGPFGKFDEQLSAAGHGQVGMLTEFMRLWFGETQRWVDALVKTVAAESPANRELLERWIATWRSRALEALAPLAAIGPGHEALQAVDNEFGSRLKKLGLTGAAA